MCAFNCRILGLRYSGASYLLRWPTSCGPASDPSPHSTLSPSQTPLSVSLHLLLSFHPSQSYQLRVWRHKAMKFCSHRFLAWDVSISLSMMQRETYLRSRLVFVGPEDSSSQASPLQHRHHSHQRSTLYRERRWEDWVFWSENKPRSCSGFVCPEWRAQTRKTWFTSSSAANMWRRWII